MKLRFIVILASVLLIYLGVNYYIGWHGLFFLSHEYNLHADILYWILFWSVVFSYLIARLGAKLLPAPVSRFLKLIGSYWFAVMSYALFLLLFVDIAAWLLSLAAVHKMVYVPILGYSLCLVVVLLIVRGSWNAWNPIVRKYEFTIHKSFGQHQQLRIAVASDLHLGTIVGNKHLQRMVDQINALDPDLILFPGDVIDDDIRPFIQLRMADTMRQLKSKYGIYAVLGNHEYYSGHIEEFVKQMADIDIEVLMDRFVQIAEESLYVIGRKDRTASTTAPIGRLELPDLLAGIDKSKPLIMMDHQPYQLDAAVNAGIDVMLCGHTHRGQMAPFHWITKRLYELDWGYLKKGDLHAVVSSGYGTWGPPVRIASRSEIIELVITFKPVSNDKFIKQ